MRKWCFRAIVCLAVAASMALPKLAAQEKGRARVDSNVREGIVWERSLAAARARAKSEGKPILLLHLFGRFDEEMC
jgi:hypothetical protein